MSRSSVFDLAVIGGGPAGLMAALSAARITRTALVLDRLPHSDGPLRIDVVPARTLALLAEYGVDPRAIGAEALSGSQGACWETETPRWDDNARTSHIERPFLECAMLELLRADNRVGVIVDGKRPLFDGVFKGGGWQAKTLIDATGRAAITARHRNSAEARVGEPLLLDVTQRGAEGLAGIPNPRFAERLRLSLGIRPPYRHRLCWSQ